MEELSPRAQRPARLHHDGVSGWRPGHPSYRGDSAERQPPSSTFSEKTVPLRGSPNPARTPGPRLGEKREPSPSGCAAPTPAARQLESISLSACLPLPPLSRVLAPAARLGPSAGLPSRRGGCRRIPPDWPLPSPALPCDPAGVPAVPARGTRPSKERLLPGGCPARGSGLQTRLGPPGCWLAAARGSRARSGCGAWGGRGGGKTPATPTPGAGAPAAAARPPPARCRVRAPAPPTCPRGRL